MTGSKALRAHPYQGVGIGHARYHPLHEVVLGNKISSLQQMDTHNTLRVNIREREREREREVRRQKELEVAQTGIGLHCAVEMGRMSLFGVMFMTCYDTSATTF